MSLLIVDESCLGQISASSSAVLVMTLAAVVRVVVEFRVELLYRFALLYLVVQTHRSLGKSELFFPLFQDRLVLSVSISNSHRPEFLESALDSFWVFG